MAAFILLAVNVGGGVYSSTASITRVYSNHRRIMIRWHPVYSNSV